MLRKQGLAIVAAACAALAGGQLVRAADAVASRSPLLLDDTTAPAATAPATAPAATTTTTPLMGMLDAVGLGKPLEDAGISINGFVEGSWTIDTSNPPGGILTDRAFDTRSNSIQFDQVDLTASRSVDYTKPLDVGFTFENIYGDDTPYFHANGLTMVSYGKAAEAFVVPGAGSTATIHPKAQYDLTQANFTISSSAVAKGIAFEGGKFTTLLGAELIDPYTSSSTNAFFSHSLIFTQEPFTHTGALGIINLSDAFTFQGGITRGWDQATEDNNGDIDFIGQLKWVVNPKATLYLNGITGDEQADTAPGTPGLDGYRTVFDIVGSYQASDQLALSFNGMYAFEPQTGDLGDGGGTGQWYGFAGYASYKVADPLTLNVRGEWFDDQDGAAPTQYSPVRQSNQYYELTVGATIHPLPNDAVFNNLFFRPEVRFDYANHAAFDAVGGLPTNHYFCTAAIDGVFAF
jgi:hypothetical protein